MLQDSTAGIFLPPQERNIAYLFQAPTLFPHMTVEENAGFGLAELGTEGEKRRFIICWRYFA